MCAGPSLAQQVLDEEDVALQAEVEEDLAASAEVHLMKGARGRSAKYGRMKSKSALHFWISGGSEAHDGSDEDWWLVCCSWIAVLTRYKSFKVFKSGKGSYKRGYYGSYHGYRSAMVQFATICKVSA